MGELIKLIPKIANPFSFAAFALAIVLFLVLRSRENVPLGAWLTLSLIVLVAILAPFFLELVDSTDIYRVRVTVLDLQQIPVEDAKVWSSIGGEPKKVAGGWQFDIPAASKPADGKVLLYASKKTAFLIGKQQLHLKDDFNPAVTIQLDKEKSVTVRGIVIDEKQQSISGARVSLTGYPNEAVFTSKDGNFVLSAHAADGQSVLLSVEKNGYKLTSQAELAGDFPVTIILQRK